MAPERDTSKLPKWAQNYIGKLERDLASAKRELNAGPESSRVFAHDYSDLKRRPLGEADVAFYPEGEDGRGSIQVKLEDKSLRIMATSSRLIIRSHASNVIYLDTER